MKPISRKILFAIAASKECSVQTLVNIFDDEQDSYIRTTVAQLKKINLIVPVRRGTYRVTPLITGFYGNLMRKLSGIRDKKTIYSMFLTQFSSDQVGLKRTFKNLLFDSGFGQLQAGVYIGAYKAPFLLDQVFQSHPELRGSIFYVETPLVQPQANLIQNLSSIWEINEFKQKINQFNNSDNFEEDLFKKQSSPRKTKLLIEELDSLVEIIKTCPALPNGFLSELQQMWNIIQREKSLINNRSKFVQDSQYHQIANNLINTVFMEENNYAND